ncbi:hypothetical protein PZA11_001406 [Diplocarpon coronariae]
MTKRKDFGCLRPKRTPESAIWPNNLSFTLVNIGHNSIHPVWASSVLVRDSKGRGVE